MLFILGPTFMPGDRARRMNILKVVGADPSIPNLGKPSTNDRSESEGS